ncbi:hypothetical protein ABT025_18850 [Streptomyces sp. NPDC002809]|uniref:hypothetical protein n=1 Tax=Streptomyces sp. NPDC002809 TaxID=3154433 RepID=UPI00332FD231
MPASKADQAIIDQRRTELVRLRRQRPKVPFDSPEVLALGYSSPNAASKDFYRALEARRKDLDIEVTAFREEQNEIIDSLLETHMPPALGGDIKASELCLKLLERQAKLNGWEHALKAELSGPGGGAMQVGPVGLAQLRDLIRTAGDPDPEEDLDDAESEDTGDDGDDS